MPLIEYIALKVRLHYIINVQYNRIDVLWIVKIRCHSTFGIHLNGSWSYCKSTDKAVWHTLRAHCFYVHVGVLLQWEFQGPFLFNEIMIIKIHLPTTIKHIHFYSRYFVFCFKFYTMIFLWEYMTTRRVTDSVARILLDIYYKAVTQVAMASCSYWQRARNVLGVQSGCNLHAATTSSICH